MSCWLTLHPTNSKYNAATKDDKTVTEFCAQENLPLPVEDGSSIRVNKTFEIRLERPNFEKFLGSLRAIYADE